MWVILFEIRVCYNISFFCVDVRVGYPSESEIVVFRTIFRFLDIGNMPHIYRQ